MKHIKILLRGILRIIESCIIGMILLSGVLFILAGPTLLADSLNNPSFYWLYLVNLMVLGYLVGI